MAFSQTARNAYLDSKFLKAYCRDREGTYQRSKINLNSYIANHDGKLEWAAGGNFAASCRDLKLDGSNTLKATCKKSNGHEVTSSINLDECITNIDGHLMFQRDRPGGFSATSKDIGIDGSRLSAKCKALDGSYKESSFDLNEYIGNIDGCLEWASASFADSSEAIRLVGSYLLAKCNARDGSYFYTAINLDEYVINHDGVLQIYVNKVMVKVTKENVKDVSAVLANYYKTHKEAHTQVAEGDDGLKYVYVSAGAGIDGILLQGSADAQVSIIHLAGKNGGIETVNLDIIQAKVETWTGLGAGVSASLNLIDAQASVFDLTLGVGVDTGIGIHDDSLTVKVLDTGFTFGRKISVSVLGSSFGIDFGRCTIQ